MSSAPVAPSLQDAKQCAECQQFFNVITRRKRQCRICMNHVCDSCSKHTLAVSLAGKSEKVRACDSCYARSLIQAAAPSSPTTPVSSNQSSLISSNPTTVIQLDKPPSSHQPDADRFLSINQIINPEPFVAPPILEQVHHLTVRTASHSNNLSSNPSDDRSGFQSAQQSPSTEYFDQSPGGYRLSASLPHSSVPDNRLSDALADHSPSHHDEPLDANLSVNFLDEPGWQSISPPHEPTDITINEAISHTRPSSFAAQVEPKQRKLTTKQIVTDLTEVNQSISRSATAVTDAEAIAQADQKQQNGSSSQATHRPVSPVVDDDSNPQSPTSALTQILKHQKLHQSANQNKDSNRAHPSSPQPASQSTSSTVLSSPSLLQPYAVSPPSPTCHSNSPSFGSSLDDSFDHSNDDYQESLDHSHPADDAVSLKLDLPMKLCLVILKKTAAEMKARYAEYLKTKEARNDSDPLSFSQFMFFSIIRTLPEFAFKKTELSYLLMRDEHSIVKRDTFVRYAPILQPVASKLDAGSLFDMLAQEVGGEMSISLPMFKAYVENLKRECHYTSHQWQDFHESFALARTEQLITMRSGVTDTSHFPPQVGRVGIGSQHLLFESLIFRKRRRIKWTDIVKIERNEDGWMRRADSAGIKIHFWRDTVEEADKHFDDDAKDTELLKRTHKSARKSSSMTPEKSKDSDMNSRVVATAVKKDSTDGKAPIKVILWDVPGIGYESSQERLRFYFYLRMVHTSQLLSADLQSHEPLIAAALLQETFDLVRRMRALENLAPHIDPMKLNPYGSFSDTDQQRFVQRVRDIVKQNQKVKDSKKTWLTSILPGLAADGKHKGAAKGPKVEDIDPEFDAYKTFEEMNNTSKEVEPFSVKTFSYNVKLFSRQLQPVIAMYTIVKSLRNWDRPEVTVAVILFLLNMCYRDFLCYIPAIIVLCNIIILVIYGWFPEEFDAWLEGKDAADSAGANKEVTAPVIISQVSDGEMNVASAITVVDRNKPKTEPTEPQGLLAKFRMYRDVAFKTKDSLQTVQNELGEINLKTMRIEGLYKWRTPHATWKFFGLLCVLLLLLSFVPFRFIFPFIMADFFTDKWQKDGSMLDRLMMEAGLPDELPDMS